MEEASARDTSGPPEVVPIFGLRGEASRASLLLMKETPPPQLISAASVSLSMRAAVSLLLLLLLLLLQGRPVALGVLGCSAV